MTTVFGHLFLAQIAIETMQETVTRIDMNILLSEFIWKAGISLSFPSLVFQLGLYIGSGFSNLGGNGRIRRVPQTRFRVESSWIFPTAFPSFPTGYNRKERGKFRWIPTWNTASMIRWIPLNSGRIRSVRFDLGIHVYKCVSNNASAIRPKTRKQSSIEHQTISDTKPSSVVDQDTLPP
jgi:hypothetical protein